MICVPAASAAPPTNDPFSAPAALPSFSLSETTAEATAEPGEPAHAGQAATHSVWYSLTPATTSFYRVEVCPSASSPLGQLSLAVYTGAELASLNPVGGDSKTNSSGTCGTRARVEFLAAAGTTYRVAVDTTHSTGGGFNLFSEALPAPDQDGDGTPDDADKCPAVGGPPPSGCPPIARKLTIRYFNGLKSFQGKLTPAGPCATAADVEVFKRRPGPDRRLGSATTDASGKYRLPRKRRPGRYYVTADAVIEPSQGSCTDTRSRTLRLR